MRLRIAVDLDGTIIPDDWQGQRHFSEPSGVALEVLDRLRKEGYYIIIHTCRVQEPDEEHIALAEGLSVEERAALVAGFLDENEIPYDEIWTKRGKPYADVYVDDKSYISLMQVWTYTHKLKRDLVAKPIKDEGGGA